jgi:glycosyltransferase involved in cell wall biosynthesis
LTLLLYGRNIFNEVLHMKLSIIIPCLNEANYITCQLEALAKQSWSEPWEVIVCDNGSTDSSVQIVEQFKTRLPNLRLLDASDRRGQAYARNVGARVAKGELLVFCDADDAVGCGWLAAMGKALARYDFVASRFEPTKLNESWVLPSRTCPQQEGVQAYHYPPYLPHASASGLGVRRSLHEAIGGFDESMLILEDTDYCWRLQRMGVNLHFASDAVIHYRFRHTLRGIYCQARNYAEYNVLLYKRYQSAEMPPLCFSWKEYVKGWLRLFQRLPQTHNSEMRAKWLWQFGWRTGRLKGSIKYRTLAL